MTAAKVYSNKMLFTEYSKIITRNIGAYTSDEVAEAIRIRKKAIKLNNITLLLQMSDNDLKLLKGAVRMAEEIAKTTNVVPKLCDM